MKVEVEEEGGSVKNVGAERYDNKHKKRRTKKEEEWQVMMTAPEAKSNDKNGRPSVFVFF